MKYGVFIFPTDTSIRPDRLASEVEARGFESLWLPEHSHIPVSRETPWGGQKDASPLPEHYWHTHDQFVALAYAAAATKTLTLATRHDIAGQVGKVRAAVADAGRDPEAFEVTAYSAKLLQLDSLAGAGVDRAVSPLPPLDEEVVIPKLDNLAEGLGLA